jgi:DNA polymerase-3 subunit delta
MKRDLPAILSDLKEGKGLRLLLLFGDDLQVQSACKTLLDQLVPEDQRGFNLERFDGRSTAWDQIEASLNTPPFLPGPKLVWVENVTYFISREQTGELGEKIRQAWRENRKDEAVKLLMDLLAVEGWTQEQLEQAGSGASAVALDELLEVDNGQASEEVRTLLAYGLSQGMDLSRRRGSGGQRLAALVDQGLPPWAFLLMTAVQVDRRMRLYKRLEEMGAVLQLVVERDRSGRISRESLTAFLNQRLREARKTIEPQAREMILLRAGNELWGLQQELAKLLLYVGDEPTIKSQDVEAIFADQGEGWVFDLTQCLGERNAVAALGHLARLLAQGEHPLKLLGTLAAEIRKLLAARQLMNGEGRGQWKRGLTYQQFQRAFLKEGAPLLTRNPYADYLCFQRADQFSLGELRACLSRVCDADLRLKSTGQNPRLVLERLILNTCLGGRKESGLASRRSGL